MKRLDGIQRLIRWLMPGLFATFLFATFAGAKEFNATVYQKFLDEYVKTDQRIGQFVLNVVDYEKLEAEKDGTASLYKVALQAFNRTDPAALTDREEKLAFWINAYNMGAIKMIMDHYPVDSIRSLKISWIRLPWGEKIISVGGKEYSLGGIEHDILIGELDEPMAHFGIVCASLSCPELAPEAYSARNVREVLERQARRFLKDSQKGLKIDREQNAVHFSQIFKFDKTTFPEGGRSAVPFIAPLLDPADREYLQTGSYEIDYLDYDWSLNSLSRAR